MSSAQGKTEVIRAPQAGTAVLTPNPLQSERVFRLLVESLSDYALFLLTPDGVVASWNPGAERMKQYKPAEIIGRHFSTFYVPDDLEARKPENELRMARETGRHEEEGWRVRKDGTRFWANVVITAVYDDRRKIRGFGKVTRDLTERRSAEVRYRQVVESVRDYAIITLDTGGIVRTWNAGAEAIKGYAPHEIIGKSFET